jgi:hypothetical protein
LPARGLVYWKSISEAEVSRIEIAVTVGIVDSVRLRGFAQTLHHAQGACSIEDELVAVAINPLRAPACSGFEFKEILCEAVTEPGSYRIRLVVDVHDADSLVAEASRRYLERFGDAGFKPFSLCEALNEVVYASSASPGSAVTGILPLGTTYDRDVEIVRTPVPESSSELFEAATRAMHPRL